MFGRVALFGEAHAADFAPDSEGEKRFAALTQIVQDVTAAAVSQQLSDGGFASMLLEKLQEDVRSILRTARAIRQEEPRLVRNFHAPANQRLAALLVTVKVLLAELEKPGLADKFIAHALPADFVPQLIADRDALINFRKELGGEDQTGVISTAAIDRLMRGGMKEVKYLDAIVRNTYTQGPARNPDYLRAWEIASAVERPPRRKKQVASNPTAGTAPAAPAAPAASSSAPAVTPSTPAA